MLLSTLVVILLFAQSALAQGDNKLSAEKMISALDRRADKMRNEIRKSNSALDLKQFGTIYYISTDGDDRNDGLSPESSIKSLERLNSLELKAGDCVLFRRGDVWRGRVDNSVLS